MLQRIVLAAPRGPCAGVNRALDIVEAALEKYGAPIYVNHDLVHNRQVVAALQKKGVHFCADLDLIPDNAVYLFSAHGVSPTFREQASRRKIKIIDATCPLVTKVHREALHFARDRTYLFYIGHRGHPEVEGTMGVSAMHLIETLADAAAVDAAALPKDRPVAVLSQTTLSVDETRAIIDLLKAKIPAIILPKAGDICYATTNRQSAVKMLAEAVDYIVIVGSKHSSNSNRLAEAAQNAGVPSLLIERFADLPREIFSKINTLGISSGASVPEALTAELLNEILALYPQATIETLEILKEDIRFSMPVI